LRVVDDLAATVDEVAGSTAFSGAIRIDRAGEVVFAKAYGMADRARGVANTVDTRFAMASGSKGFTALVVVSLVVDGVLSMDTPARSLLGDDLPLVDDGVTVEHLLGHRSGIGDYLDEDDAGHISDYVLPVSVHLLDTTEAFVPILDGYPQVYPPGERFAYNNGGFVVLAVLAERAAGVPYVELVQARVCEPAGMERTAFLRSDELPGDAALGYLDVTGPRTNVFHLPVVGSGDGGAYTTLEDVHRLWAAFLDGRIVPPAFVAEMTTPRSDAPDNEARYGLGVWLDEAGPGVFLDGYDAGVSFRSHHDPVSATTWTVLSNWSDGAWPLVKAFKRATQPG
jgi:CubicO group peptidase (beta-lactamase class C family)